MDLGTLVHTSHRGRTTQPARRDSVLGTNSCGSELQTFFLTYFNISFTPKQPIVYPFAATISIAQDTGFLQQRRSYTTSEAMTALLLVNRNRYIYSAVTRL